jgi:hypothetical protein
MPIDLVNALDAGSTIVFALLVYTELRHMRKTMDSVIPKLLSIVENNSIDKTI